MQNNPTKEKTRSKFFKHVEKTPTCWIWKNGKIRSGYGIFYFPNKIKQFVAHRASWIIHKGPIPKGLFVCHKCDIRLCVRPVHLFLGTAQDNSNDMVKKGRDPWGEKCYNSRLSNEDIAEIRFLYKRSQGGILGRIYGVSPRHIWQIVKNKRWKHI